MEDQTITTTTRPRVTLKRFGKGCSWDIASSESGNLPEIKLIIDEIEKANEIMEKKFNTKKKVKKE